MSIRMDNFKTGKQSVLNAWIHELLLISGSYEIGLDAHFYHVQHF